MKFTAQFGSMSGEALRPKSDGPFRIAILGDFSGRAARGEAGIGDELASRRAIRFDIDKFEDVVEDFATEMVLPIGKDGSGIEVKLSSFEDLHPDELYDNVEMFEELSAFRQRLNSGSMAASAISDLEEWAEEFGTKRLITKTTSTANTIPANKPLSEFASLIGGARAEVEASDAEDLIQRIVAPYVVAAPDKEAEAMKEAVDEALSGAMRLVLHHPDFQAVEAQWRTLDFLARRIETDNDVDLFLFDVSAEEIAADVASVEDLAESGLARLLREPKLPDGDGTFALAVGLYTFEETPPHAELLGRIAQVAAGAGTPFISAITPQYLETPLKDRHALVSDAWTQLRALPAAQYLALASPRFMLRLPYGQKSDPIYPFEFEEFTQSEGLSGLLWANPAALAAVLIAKSRNDKGGAMELGDVMAVDDMPFHYTNDRYGDQVALPSTERNMNEPKVAASVERGFIPVISPRGRDEVRLGSFQSLAGTPLAGPWRDPGDLPDPTPPSAPAPAAAPEAAADDIEEDFAEAAEDAGEDDLDAMLADLGLDDTGDEEDAGGEDEGTGDPELDALLAGFDDELSEETDGEEEESDFDAELEALLADL